MNEKEVVRELFVAGYLQALDDVQQALSSAGVKTAPEWINRLREKAAGVQARAAIAKALDK